MPILLSSGAARFLLDPAEERSMLGFAGLLKEVSRRKISKRKISQ